MATRGPGLPYSTGWKRYQLPWTELVDGKGLYDVVNTNCPMNIYVNDDVFFNAPIVNNYAFIMTNDGLGDQVGASTSHWRQGSYWINGTGHATYSGTDKKMKLGSAVDATHRHGKAVYGMNASTQNTYHEARQLPNPASPSDMQEVITIEPGLHMGWSGTNAAAYSDDDQFGFKIDIDYVKQLPKQYNNVWSSWVYAPIVANDVSYTADLPTELNELPFTIVINPIKFGPKQSFGDISLLTAKDYGLTTKLHYLTRGQDWPAAVGDHQNALTVATDIDYSVGQTTHEVAPMHMAAAATGSQRATKMRMSFEFPSTHVSEATMIPGQYLQILIIPQ
jgi:hypothetical protein